MEGKFFHKLGSFFGLMGQDGRYYTTQMLGNSTPNWVDSTAGWTLYNEIPELQAVINRYAKMVASANPVVVDKDGNVIDPNGHWIFDIIDRPNAMQSWGPMVFMVALNKCVTNNALIYTPKGDMGNVQNMTPLAWNNVKVVATRKGLRQTDMNGFIEKFQIPTTQYSNFEDFEPKEVIYFCEPDGINLFATRSKLESLRYPLSNIASAYRKRNVLLENLFALGILTSEKQDGVSFVPLNPKQRKKLTEEIMQRHKGKPIITDKPMKWEPMSFPTKDLMLFEEMTADKVAIIDQYGLNQNMFGSAESKGSTFSNVEMGERQAYNATIIPDTELMYDEITKQSGLDKDGYFLKPSFEHISVLKADDNKAAEAMFKRSQAVEKISTLVTLTDEEKRALLKV